MTSGNPVKTCNECVIICLSTVCLWAVYKDELRLIVSNNQKGLAFINANFSKTMLFYIYQIDMFFITSLSIVICNGK